MGRPNRTRAELIQELANQRQALAASCENYDKGNDWEAARLATTIFTLVHDGGKIVSLLAQLGVRASMRFVSSGATLPRVIGPQTPLVFYRMESTASGVTGKTVPILGGGPPDVYGRVVQFQHWWNDESIFADGPYTLNRRRLVFALRHQDGGGHVGSLTDEAYVRFKLQAIGFVIASNQPEQPLYALTATMRQVAWELTKTLDDHGPIE